jgi:hypothetical protein
MAKNKAATRAAGNAPERLKHLTTDETKNRAAVEEGRPTPWNRGPQIGESQIKDSDYLANYASPGELGVFRAAVAARRAKIGQNGWRDLPDGTRIPGDRVLAVCGSCGKHIWVKSGQTTAYCPACNMAQRLNGGRLRPVSPAEEKAWFESETARYKKWKAEKPRRDAEERQLANIRMKLGGIR